MTTEEESHEKLDRHYADFESDWHVTDRTTAYKALVTSSDNAKEPFHRWFHLKEAFAHDLLQRLKADETERPDLADWSSVLDPFAGGGTTPLSALMLNAGSSDAVIAGVERNAALRVVADAKLLGFTLPKPQLPSLLEAARRLDFSTSTNASTESSTLNNSRFFDSTQVAALLNVRAQLQGIDDVRTRTILECALLASVEGTGKVRRDGRALRFDPNKKTLTSQASFASRVEAIANDIRGRTENHFPSFESRVQLGDARAVDQLESLQGKTFNRIVFSPPYPNNIDYTEVYKVENWVLGEWRSPADMRAQRLATLRSHPSVLFPDEYDYLESSDSEAISALVDPLIDSIPKDRYSRGRDQLVRGYVDDMRSVLRACRSAIASNGRLYCIVGNSVHGHSPSGFVVAADVLIARIGELTGWRVEEIRVARMLTRRASDSRYVRESVVVLEPA
ncbi:MAG TPA: hypothetical protein VFT70_12070 [Nocardioides sp.]|nr:hypothetical protein [Nocardioides sp.]